MAIEHLMVAAPLVATEVGEEYESLPPHVTLFPWFDIPTANWPRFNAALGNVASETVQPTIKGGDAAVFGADHRPIAVRRLNRATQTFNIIHGFDIHADIHRAVRRYGGDFDPSFVGQYWRPHVSNKRNYALAEDEEVRLSELTVFQRRIVSGKKMVKAVHKWEDAI